LESPLGQYLLNSKQIGTNILTINPKDLKDIKVPVLDMNEQVKIAEGFRNTVTKYREAIRQAEEEKKQSFLKLYEQMGIRSSFEIVE
jgi:type I restriction enzyme M protein